MSGTDLEFITGDRSFKANRDGVEYAGSIEGATFTFIATREALQAAARMDQVPGDDELLAIFDEHERMFHAAAHHVWVHAGAAPGIYLVIDADIERVNR